MGAASAAAVRNGYSAQVRRAGGEFAKDDNFDFTQHVNNVNAAALRS